MIHRVKRSTMWIIGALLLVGLGFTVYHFYFGSKIVTNRIISEHVEKLVKVLEEIDTTCGVLSVARERTPIDFLTVRSFSGSEVGSLNLAHPERWKGPYVERNLTMQGKLYELVKTHEGYYVVPGDGVELANGKIMGKDIIFEATSDIESFVNDKIGLEYDGRPLAQRVRIMKDGRSDMAQAAGTDSGGFDL